MKTIAIVKTKVEIATNVYATKTHWEEITAIDFFKGDENAPKTCKPPQDKGGKTKVKVKYELHDRAINAKYRHQRR